MEILKKLPDAYESPENDPSIMSENDLQRLQNIISTVKQGKSFIEHLQTKREFNNPENIQVSTNFFIKDI